MASDALDPAAALRDRLGQAAEKSGLNLIGFVVEPGPVGGPHRCRAWLEIVEDEQPNDDEVIEDLEMDFVQDRVQRLAEDKSAELTKLVQENLDEEGGLW